MKSIHIINLFISSKSTCPVMHVLYDHAFSALIGWQGRMIVSSALSCVGRGTSVALFT